MMKRYLRQVLVLLPALLVLAGCVQEEVEDSAFEIGITYPRAKSLLYEVIPATNDYYYMCAAVSVADYNRLGEEGVIDSLHDMNKDLYHIIKTLYREYFDQRPPSFREMLENGAIYGNEYNLHPETNYYLCVMCYNKHNRPIRHIVKQSFATKDSLASSITFDVAGSGTKVIVTPSNDEKYFWDIETKEVIDTRYYGMPDYYYSAQVENYERYGFINTMLSQGRESEDVADMYTLHTQDTLYVTAAGYYNETNSQIEVYELVYQGDNGFSVRRVEDTWTLDDKDAEEQAARSWLLRHNHVAPRLKR